MSCELKSVLNEVRIPRLGRAVCNGIFVENLIIIISLIRGGPPA